MKIDVIIPTFRPGRKLLELLDRLQQQSVRADRILVINTEEKYFEELIYGTDFVRKFPDVEVHHISELEFDHGGTRNMAVTRCSGDGFLCMTQDALPADNRMIENLLRALEEDETVAVAYARQLPGAKSDEIERFTRQFNYPELSCVKGKEQLKEMGIKTYFCSNVCALYRRNVYMQLGGFEKHTIFNEDMIYAARAVQAGWRIAYAADAQVFHSHHYTCAQQFHRNFDNGVSQACHPEIFAAVSSESEGLRLMKKTAAHLCRIGKPWLVVKLAADCAARYAGFFLGRRYDRLPRRLVTACSSNKHYWK